VKGSSRIVCAMSVRPFPAIFMRPSFSTRFTHVTKFLTGFHQLVYHILRSGALIWFTLV
jgi:hypothetical protein